MLSNKMTVSLMSLITIIALAFVVPSAMAADPFDVTFEGRESVTYMVSTDTTVAVQDRPQDTALVVTIKSGLPVADFSPTVTAFDKNNIVIPNSISSDQIATGATIDELINDPAQSNAGRYDADYVPTSTERKYRLAIDPQGGTAGDPIVAKVVVKVGELTTNDPTAVDAKGALVKTKLSSYTRVITVSAAPAANADRPNVVSIQRLRPGSQTVVSAFEEEKVTGAFDVRIVFTEKPHDFKLAHINAEGGTASNLVVGVPFTRLGVDLSNVDDSGDANFPFNTIRPHPLEGMYTHQNNGPFIGVPQGEDGVTVPFPTGDDEMYHQYRVTITPHRRVDMVKISIKEFHDNASPFPNVYKPFDVANKPNGREQLRLAVATDIAALGTGFMFYLPHAEGAQITYAGTAGHYILTKDKAGSGINFFHEKDEENIAHLQTPAQLLYNVRASGSLPNLETFLANNGTIDLVAYDGTAAGAAYISEVMWGTDASQDDATKSQWIEIANAGTAAIGIGENKWALWFYQAHETPRGTYVKDDGTAGVLVDRIGTKTAAASITAVAVAAATTPAAKAAAATAATTRDVYWSIAGKGQSGRSGIDAGAADVAPVAPIQKIISMYRTMDATTAKPSDGTMASSWMQSAAPSVNFKLGLEGRYDASPGSTRVVTPSETAATAAAAKAKAAAAAAAAAKAADTSVSMPQVGQIYISEVMFAGGGTLPQWIEISNGSRSEQVNLSGWTLTVENATADADVSVGSKAVFTIPEGTKIDPSGQDATPSTILVVTEQGRNNIDDGAKGAGQILNLWTAQQTELILLGVTKRRYSLLSDMAFKITIAPPVPIVAPAAKTAAPTTAAGIAAARAAAAAKKAADATAALVRKAATDVVGNLGTAGTATWALPMDEGARSSIIRRHVPVSIGSAAPEAGEMMDSWVLASDTSFAQVTHIRASSYYGSADDVGTPGFRAGGALPVELSHFRPARDKVTGAVVITWSTQSELNNAGFFIKRSQQRDGEFKVINATMVQGAGTTSEKQFYTYQDTTAQPNVVYYYQIEDVSLDGNRQTLTRGIRLKGHIGAVDKATTTWGDLKTQE